MPDADNIFKGYSEPGYIAGRVDTLSAVLVEKFSPLNYIII